MSKQSLEEQMKQIEDRKKITPIMDKLEAEYKKSYGGGKKLSRRDLIIATCSFIIGSVAGFALCYALQSYLMR